MGLPLLPVASGGAWGQGSLGLSWGWSAPAALRMASHGSLETPVGFDNRKHSSTGQCY